VRRPQPDHRIAERRSDVAHAVRRRRLAGFGTVALIVAFVVSGFVVLHSPLFSARHLVVTGAVHESIVSILSAAGLENHPPLIDVNPAGVSSAVEALPWIDSATVSRHWPEGLTVSVTERTPVGEVALAGGRVALLDATGRVLEIVPVSAVPEGMLTLDDVGHVPRPGAALDATGIDIVGLAAAVPRTIRPLVKFVGTSRSDGLILMLDAGPEVVIGPRTDLAAKFVGLATLLAARPRTVDASRVIDLRVATSPVLTP
jgi:cell division protein FtsQ